MTKTVLDLTLYTDKPTDLCFADLYTWVIWQHPQAIGHDGFCGAVCPPVAEHGWWAAIVYPQQERVLLCAHRDPFATPEQAIEWVSKHLG